MTRTNVIKKHFCLTAIGIILQLLGNACLFAASLIVMKELNAKIQQVLIRELSK